MTQAPRLALEAERLTDLRGRAALHLQGPPKAAHGGITGAVDALAVLHDLASNPATATDALTLLHEVQVHQVELELQAQELRDSRAELEGALRRLSTLYEHQPVGCFTVDAQGRIFEVNATGAQMLGMRPDQAIGRPLLVNFGAEPAQRLWAAMQALDAGAAAQHAMGPADTTAEPLGPWRLQAAGRPARWVWAHLAADPAAPRYLLTLAPASAPPTPPTPPTAVTAREA